MIESTDDWTFREIKTNSLTHGLHQYPARMHPEIARRVISKYSTGTKDVVLDPFMGSGGVLVESLIQGRNTIGIDLNPFAVLLSKVKTYPINPKNLEDTFETITEKCHSDYKNKIKYNNHPEKLDLSFWYPEDSIKKLPILKKHIQDISNENIRNFFEICFSLTSRRVSYQKNSIYKIYRMKPEKREEFNPDTFKKFSEICNLNISGMKEFFEKMEKTKAKAFPILGDSRDLKSSFQKVPREVLEENKTHLVVTSPPYGDHGTTVAYGQFSKHLGLWLDLENKDELLSVDSRGLGGKKIKQPSELGSPLLEKILNKIEKKDNEVSKKTALSERAKDVYAFFYDLDLCLEQLSKYLKSGSSHLCFVVANRTVRREKIPMDNILIELASKYDFAHEQTIYRTIANKAMAVKNAPENIANFSSETMNEESIVIFKF